MNDSQHSQLSRQMIADPWIANSLMQKAIRRGDAEIAQWAAASFYALRGSAIWRRLIIIACEDVGIGSAKTVIRAVRACTNLAYRRINGGNAAVIATTVRELAQAVKDRSADHLIVAAALHPKLESARRKMASVGCRERLELLRDQELPLPVRAVAAWYASGIEWDRERRISGGDIDALLAVYRELGVGEELINAVALGARRTREPLVVLLPLLLLSANKAEPRAQSEMPLSPAHECVCGIPLYAFDLHTRIGRQALEKFWRENDDVRAVVTRHVPGRSGLDAVRVAAFHIEAALIDRPLNWQLGRKLEVLGIETDLLTAGVVLESHALMLEVVRRNLPHLNELRASVYKRHLGQI